MTWLTLGATTMLVGGGPGQALRRTRAETASLTPRP
jgi:hypothetical protein